MKLLTPLFLTLLLSRAAIADPLGDLTSPDPKTRETAAAELAKDFKPIPKSTWDSLSTQLHEGLSKNDCVKLLEAAGAKEEASAGSGPLLIRRYKLDRDWTAVCFFKPGPDRNQPGEDKLDHSILAPGMPPLPIEPPKNFTGVWTCYFPNGKKYSEARYEKGLKSGDGFTWDSAGGLNSEDHWREGKLTGVWKNYDYDGKVLSTYEPEAAGK